MGAIVQLSVSLGPGKIRPQAHEFAESSSVGGECKTKPEPLLFMAMTESRHAATGGGDPANGAMTLL